jgi:excinuclease ABC subunit A
MRNSIGVKGAKENNLKNVSLEIPREKFIVLTGLSGSGKSSLAFETIYAEGQRRFLDSLSAFSRKFVSKIKKPDVDFVYGLSPVISIEQKSTSNNPRSTVGTMTDIYDYLRVLFTTSGLAHCSYCDKPVPTFKITQMAEHVLALPKGSVVEISAPVFKLYGEDYKYTLSQIRTQGYRRLRVDDELLDMSEGIELDESREYAIDAVIDTLVVQPDMLKNVIASIENGLRVGEGFLRFRVLKRGIVANGAVRNGGKESREAARKWYANFACPEHGVVMGELEPVYFSFNEPPGACPTCGGLGTYLHVHPDLLIPNKARSIKDGAFVHEAFHYDKNLWYTQMLHSTALHFGFSLDVPFSELPQRIVTMLLHGAKGERFPLVLPEGAKNDERAGKSITWDGFITDIERRYRAYRQQGIANQWMEEWLKKVMVEHTCPACEGTKLKRQRLQVVIGEWGLVNDKSRLTNPHSPVPDPQSPFTIHQLGDLTLTELREYLLNMPPLTRNRAAGEQIVKEIVSRLDLLIGIGVDYLSLNRKAGTLSGGESQRIRLSVQIGGELQGMLYVLDEPSIGLHARDNEKMIKTLKRLRDIGNTVIVVEHDEATMRAADHIIEMGPGPGVHGGEVVAQGTLAQILKSKRSLTGQYLSGKKCIPRPEAHRTANGKALVVRGARENNLKHIDVHIPLGLFVCITGVSGSGKSTLINDILFKKLYSIFHDNRVLSGAHDGVDGVEHLHDVIDIDQTPIGRTATSNPATYIGVYDPIRELFARTPESQARGYTAGQFSFNNKGGRCEECQGRGLITTSLLFMADVEAICPICKGKRYTEETLEVRYRGKSIGDVLDMSIEEAAQFFAAVPIIAHKLGVLMQLGLSYLRLGQSSTTISGGEAQRVKLALELGKIKRGGHNIYILDEPTTGLHLADIQRLLDALNKLVDAGHSVVVIEHHMDVIKTADWVIDLGPEGGKHGGRVVAQGTPEDVARCNESYTGRFLKRVLK